MPEAQSLLADRLFGTLRRHAPEMPEATAWKLVAAIVATIDPATVLPPQSTLTQAEAARDQGFSGDVCPSCGNFTMRRNGPCLTCSSCGHNTGCD